MVPAQVFALATVSVSLALLPKYQTKPAQVKTMTLLTWTAACGTRRRDRMWPPMNHAGWFAIVACACFEIPFSACYAQPSTFTPYVWDATVHLPLEAHGERRQYHVLLPHDARKGNRSTAAPPLPSILMLHGAFSNASVQASGQTLTEAALRSG